MEGFLTFLPEYSTGWAVMINSQSCIEEGKDCLQVSLEVRILLALYLSQNAYEKYKHFDTPFVFFMPERDLISFATYL